jgi:capsular polysaccharide transport system permease protein
MNKAFVRTVNQPGEIPALENKAPSAFWLRWLRAGLSRVGDLRIQFVALVVIPTLLSMCYFGLVATKRYVSHAEYIVRGVNAHSSTGLGAILSTMGISRAADDTSVIESFIKSREAIRQLDQRLDLRKIYGRSEADFLSRYPWPWERDTFERLYARLQMYIYIVIDSTTGVTTLEVSAFRPDDAKLVATTLLQLAEEMANEMNDRAQADTVKHARQEVERSRQAVLDAQANLTKFRNSQALLDPVSYASVLLSGISKLTLDRANTQAQITQTSELSPSNPGIPSLQAQAAALDKKIAEERSALAGGNGALSDKVSSYDQLTLTRDLADKGYGSALAALLDAQQEAQRQSIYIEEMVPANLPDDDTEPQRLRLIVTVFVLSFAVFSMLWVLTVGAKDHAQ